MKSAKTTGAIRCSLTDEKRIIIETLRKEGRSLSYIVERIGCSKSTVSKEIKRNRSKRGYRHKKANGKARARIAAKAAKRRKFAPQIVTAYGDNCIL